MGDNLKQKMLGALTWASVDRFGQQAVQIIIGMILARLLTPDDFGLIGLIMIFVALSTVLVDSGFSQALLRKKNADELDYNSVFYFNITVSILVYLILFFLAPHIAIFFNEPQLTKICRVIFIAIFFNALYLIPIAKMLRVLDFKNGAKINLFSVTCSGIIGVILAYNGIGVWALVAQQVLFHFFRMISLHFFVKWRPKLIFSFKVIRDFWTFSMNLLGTSVLNVVFNNMYFLILGKFYTKYEVGYYSQANKLSETINSTFQTVLLGSTFPLLVKIHTEDERFRRIFRELSQKISLITFPIMLGAIAAAKPLIVVLYTTKFLPSVLYFQLICLGSLFIPLYTLIISALNARGQSRSTFRVEFIKKLLIMISILAFFRYGVISLLIGYIISCTIAFIISVFYLKSNLNHFIKHQISDVIGNIAIGLFIAVIVFLLSLVIANLHVLLITQLIVAGIIYIGSVRLFYKDLFDNALNFISNKVSPFRNKYLKHN